MDCRWYLEGIAADGTPVRYEIDALPFRIGRDPANELVLTALGMSRRHAALTRRPDGTLVLTDLRSTNGTYVNTERIHDSCVLGANDIVHFGNAQFRVRAQAPADVAGLDEALASEAGPFMELLGGRGIGGAVQPIVDARSGERFGFELFGRGTHPDLPASAPRLFDLAAALGREVELSRAFREHGIRAVAERAAGATLFVNTHPRETFDPTLVHTLRRAREAGVAVDIVLEVSEAVFAEVTRMRKLAAQLREIGVRLAYDDFGAAPPRLNELVETPTDFVKFDMALVHRLSDAPASRRKHVADLVRLVHGLGSVPLAEGVERAADAEVCREMGFDLLQGYHTGRPLPLELL